MYPKRDPRGKSEAMAGLAPAANPAPETRDDRRERLLNLDLTTDRLSTRLLRETDAGWWLEVLREGSEWLRPWSPRRPQNFLTLEVQSLSLTRAFQECVNDSGYYFCAFLKDQPQGPGTFMGFTGLTGIARGPFQSAYLGYWAAPTMAGKGLMREMVAEVVRWGFEDAKLHRIQAAIQPHNESSLKLIRALDFRHEGKALRYLEIDGQWADHEIFARTVED